MQFYILLKISKFDFIKIVNIFNKISKRKCNNTTYHIYLINLINRKNNIRLFKVNQMLAYEFH